MAVIEPKFRRLRAMKMVEGKILRNMTNQDLAKEFHCSVDTVERTLTWAKRADIFATYEDKIVQELIPLAHTAIRDALADGNAKIAVEIFKGLNLLRTGPAAAGTVQQAKDDDLAAYIAAKRDRAQLEANTITVVAEEDKSHATSLAKSLPNHPDPLAAGGVSVHAPIPTPTHGHATGQDLLAETGARP